MNNITPMLHGSSETDLLFIGLLTLSAR